MGFDVVAGSAAASLAELGIDDSHHAPTALTLEGVAAADIVVVMKPGLSIPQVDGVRYETWSLPDPSGWDVDGIRALRDDIWRRVAELHLPEGAQLNSASS